MVVAALKDPASASASPFLSRDGGGHDARRQLLLARRLSHTIARRRRDKAASASETAGSAANAPLLLLASGVLLAAASALAFLLLLTGQIALAVERVMRDHTRLTPGSTALQYWLNPPITPTLHIYLFNVTNAAEFESGSAVKPALFEVGPFVYEAKQERVVDAWGGNNSREEVTFRMQTIHHFLPSESVGDPRSMSVTVPNVLALTGMLKEEVRQQPDVVKQSVVWPLLDDRSLVSTGAGLFVTLTADELLWGHEDERACLADDAPSGEDDAWADWGEEEAQSGAGKRSFLRADGRCMFGLLAHKNATLSPPVRMTTGAGATAAATDKGRLLALDGRPRLGVWRAGSDCDAVRGANEITALPPFRKEDDGRFASQDFDGYVDLLCRKVRLSSVGTSEVDHVSAVKLAARPDTFRFDQTDGDDCYFQSGSGLPPGAMDLAKCAEGGPIVASFPHFLHADEWYLSQVSGVSPADAALHEMSVDLEPTLGVPLSARIRFQLSLSLRRDAAFPPLRRLAAPLVVLPVFWAQEGFESLGAARVAMLRAALAAPAVAQAVIVAALFLPGLATLFLALRRWRWRRRPLGYQLPLRQEEEDVADRARATDTDAVKA